MKGKQKPEKQLEMKRKAEKTKRFGVQGVERERLYVIIKYRCFRLSFISLLKGGGFMVQPGGRRNPCLPGLQHLQGLYGRGIPPAGLPDAGGV